MDFLLRFHGELRWLLALVGLIGLVKFSLGWARRAEFKGIDRGLIAAFTGLLDLNALLGLILLFVRPGGLLPFRIEHATTMLLAVVVAHLSAVWRRRAVSIGKFRSCVIVVFLVLLLVLVGVTRLRGGWVF